MHVYLKQVIENFYPPAAGSIRTRNVHLVPANLGQGKDYFDEMFRDVKNQNSLTTTQVPDCVRVPSPPQAPRGSPQSPPATQPGYVEPADCGTPPEGSCVIIPDRPPSTITHDYNTHTNRCVLTWEQYWLAQPHHHLYG